MLVIKNPGALNLSGLNLQVFWNILIPAVIVLVLFMIVFYINTIMNNLKDAVSIGMILDFAFTSLFKFMFVFVGIGLISFIGMTWNLATVNSLQIDQYSSSVSKWLHSEYGIILPSRDVPINTTKPQAVLGMRDGHPVNIVLITDHADHLAVFITDTKSAIPKPVTIR